MKLPCTPTAPLVVVMPSEVEASLFAVGAREERFLDFARLRSE